MIQYFKVENYSMKCRLYPTKTQAEDIDRMIHGVHVLHNMILHDMREDFTNTVELPSKDDPEKSVHFPNFNEAFKKVNLDKYREHNYCIKITPGMALSSKTSGLLHDMVTSFNKTGNHPIEVWGEKYTNENGEEITKGISYYSKKKPRESLCFSTSISNISYPGGKVLKININSSKCKIEGVKIRGWNQNIRFDASCEMNFIDWIEIHKKDTITIRIKKDNCGDYWIIFLLKNVYKPVKIAENKKDFVGIDVGEITLATLSDGTKFDNIFDHTKKFKKDIKGEYDTIKFYNRKLSRSEGWKNTKFRDRVKEEREKRKNNEEYKEINPSKNYTYYDMKYKKLNKKVQNQRRHYYHNVANQIITSFDTVGIEGLNVRDMQIKKDGKTRKTRKTRSRKNNKQTAENT